MKANNHHEVPCANWPITDDDEQQNRWARTVDLTVNIVLATDNWNTSFDFVVYFVTVVRNITILDGISDLMFLGPLVSIIENTWDTVLILQQILLNYNWRHWIENEHRGKVRTEMGGNPETVNISNARMKTIKFWYWSCHWF